MGTKLFPGTTLRAYLNLMGIEHLSASTGTGCQGWTVPDLVLAFQVGEATLFRMVFGGSVIACAMGCKLFLDTNNRNGYETILLACVKVLPFASNQVTQSPAGSHLPGFFYS
jgi:hypothetical protein